MTKKEIILADTALKILREHQDSRGNIQMGRGPAGQVVDCLRFLSAVHDPRLPLLGDKVGKAS